MQRPRNLNKGLKYAKSVFDKVLPCRFKHLYIDPSLILPQKVTFSGHDDLSDNLFRLFQQFLNLEIPVALTELFKQLLPLRFLLPAAIKLLQTHQEPLAFINGHTSSINHCTLQ